MPEFGAVFALRLDESPGIVDIPRRMPTFAHPLALWALLGIPWVLAVHFLQRRSRKVTATTLFLLQQLQRESEKGNRIERLRLSVPLWLQLLMVLLFTWLLAGPRWLRPGAVHRIAVVLDSSASMQAFRPAVERALQDTLSRQILSGARAELALLSTATGAASLYFGPSAPEMIAALGQWQPFQGTHDFAPALRSARSLAGPLGTVILITDHPPAAELPFAAKTLSVGQETANVGWAGVRVEEKDGQWLWRAVVKNYSPSAQTREWQAVVDNKVSPPVKLTLEPRETRILSGPFPENQKEAALKLVLTPDALTLDDELPVLLPRPKNLSLSLPPAPKEASSREMVELFDRLSDTRREAEAAKADIRIFAWPPSLALEDTQHACVFAGASKTNSPPALQGAIVAEAHPLVEGLNWQSLLVREGMVIPQDKRDLILLWQGARPLVSLRHTALGARQLFCHFDLATSNARKLPALAILLHRFLEQVRQDKIAPESQNFDVHQRLHVAHHRGDKAASLTMLTPDGKPEDIPLHQAHLLRAPALPGFFEIHQGNEVLLTASAHFADTREADLSGAKPFDETVEMETRQTESLQEKDPNWRMWILLLLATLLASWWWGRDKSPAASLQQPSRPTS